MPPTSSGRSFLLAPADLDLGDAPAAAAEALVVRGIRAVIAPGFERGFYEVSFGEGLLPAIADAPSLERLAAHLDRHPEGEITVDLEKQTIECDGLPPLPFEVDPRGRNKLLLGLSDFDEMARYRDAIVEQRAEDRRRRPWLYGPG